MNGKLHKEGKQARHHWLNNKTGANANHYSNEKRNATYRIRYKGQSYLEQRTEKIEVTAR